MNQIASATIAVIAGVAAFLVLVAAIIIATPLFADWVLYLSREALQNFGPPK